MADEFTEGVIRGLGDGTPALMKAVSAFAAAFNASAEPEAAPPVEQADARAPARDERERAAAAIRAMQEALAPHVDALYQTDAGMDVMEAYDHYGRAADALRLSIPGWTGLVLAELQAAAELLRTAAGRSAAAAVALNPIATMTEQASAAVETWPITHASAEPDRTAGVEDARLVLLPTTDEFILTDAGAEVGRYASEADALAAVATFMPPADDGQGKPFNAFLTPEGFESGDGRLWEIGTVTWRDPPLALMFQDTASHGPGDADAAWFAGAIDRVYRDPADATRIMGRGRLVPGADGERAEAMIRAGLRGVSIDGIRGGGLPPVEQVMKIDQEGTPIAALVRYADTRVMGATVVAHPAFEPCCIWFDDEPTPERVTQTHGQQIPTDLQPEVVDTGSEIAALVASSGGPMQPPKAWFYVPPPDDYRAVTVDAAGQLMGHVGPAGSCHIGIAGKCETIPTSSTGYRYFHRTTALTAEGEKVPCGWLTMDTGHMPTAGNPSAMATMAHYDNTGTQVAKVRVVDTPHGPWMCGAVAPGLSEQTLWKLQGPDVSGDWRDHEGHYREMMAVLAVPLPGFMPKPRPEALVASGRIVAQTGTLPCDDCGPPAAVADFPTSNGISARLAMAERLLRPQYMEALAERVSPEAMVEAARLAADPDPSQVWRDRMHV